LRGWRWRCGNWPPGPGVNPASVRPEPMIATALASAAHRRFQHPLDGGGVELALPAVIAGAVIFQKEADVAPEVHTLKILWREIER